MAKNVDLNMLKTEIDNRKKQKNMTQSPLGENVGAGIAPRDVFLNGLVESLTTGRETAASSLLKTVDNKASVRKGEAPRHNVAPIVQQPMQNQQLNEVDMSPERDEQLYRDIETKRKQTLAESMSEFTKVPAVGAPMRNQPPQQGTPGNLNEQYLAETIKKHVNNYLVENLTPIFEEAIKDTMLEIYAVERIKNVLQENKDLIRTVVIETIREIQAKNKAKAQQ